MKKVLCALLLGIFLVGCSNKVEEAIQLPETETVTAVQMILLRRTTDDFGRAKLQKLMEEIETAEMVSGEEDFNYYYALMVSQYRQDDFSETDADAMALEKLMREARMYEYGRQNGYSITEDNKEEKAFGYLVQELNHNVEQDIKQEFRDGIAYKVGDTECWSVEEYWNIYYNTIIYPATQEYFEQEFMPKYEDAKVFYESLMTGAEGAE